MIVSFYYGEFESKDIHEIYIGTSLFEKGKKTVLYGVPTSKVNEYDESQFWRKIFGWTKRFSR